MCVFPTVTLFELVLHTKWLYFLFWQGVFSVCCKCTTTFKEGGTAVGRRIHVPHTRIHPTTSNYIQLHPSTQSLASVPTKCQTPPPALPRAAAAVTHNWPLCPNKEGSPSIELSYTNHSHTNDCIIIKFEPSQKLSSSPLASGRNSELHPHNITLYQTHQETIKHVRERTTITLQQDPDRSGTVSIYLSTPLFQKWKHSQKNTKKNWKKRASNWSQIAPLAVSCSIGLNGQVSYLYI